MEAPVLACSNDPSELDYTSRFVQRKTLSQNGHGVLLLLLLLLLCVVVCCCVLLCVVVVCLLCVVVLLLLNGYIILKE